MIITTDQYRPKNQQVTYVKRADGILVIPGVMDQAMSHIQGVLE